MLHSESESCAELKSILLSNRMPSKHRKKLLKKKVVYDNHCEELRESSQQRYAANSQSIKLRSTKRMSDDKILRAKNAANVKHRLNTEPAYK